MSQSEDPVVRDRDARPVADYLLILVKWRRVLAINILVVVIGAAVLSLILPAWYSSTGSLLPREVVGTAGELGFLSMMEMTLPSISIPGVSTESEVMTAILESRTVAQEVIETLDLKKIYGSKTLDGAVKKLRKRTRIEADENGVVKIKAEARDPDLAAEIARAFIGALERYNTEARATVGRATRKFTERRLYETEGQLAAAEECLAQFQQENASIQIDEQARAVINALADLETRAAETDIALGMMRSYVRESHPEIQRLETELRQYRRALDSLRSGKTASTDSAMVGGTMLTPLSSMPTLLLEYVRLTRDVEVFNRVYIFLIQELESAKIQEAKDTPTTQILDPPVPPETRSRPKRTVMVVLGGLIGFLVGVLFAFVLEFLDTTDASHPTRRSLDAAVAMVRGDLARFRGR